MSFRIITVSREFGSGGHTVAEHVASWLGVPIYDKDLVLRIAKETGFAPQYVEEESEYARSKSVWSYAFAAPGVPGIMGGMTAPDYLWVMQRKVILDLAEKEECVIVGRCADFILRDRTDCLNVFVHASPSFRASRIVELYGESEDPPEKRLADKDAKRRAHYRHFTGGVWGMSDNYQLSLDSGVLGIDRCTDIIVSVARG